MSIWKRLAVWFIAATLTLAASACVPTPIPTRSPGFNNGFSTANDGSTKTVGNKTIFKVQEGTQYSGESGKVLFDLSDVGTEDNKLFAEIGISMDAPEIRLYVDEPQTIAGIGTLTLLDVHFVEQNPEYDGGGSLALFSLEK